LALNFTKTLFIFVDLMTLDDDSFREKLECKFLIYNSVNGQIYDPEFNSSV